MQRLSLHIEYLLTRHDCVIVPGFGAFIATEQESRFDSERGTIEARRREITFNASVQSEDGLLAHSLARKEKIGYEEGRRLLSALTHRLKEELRVEGESTLGMVGTLHRNAEGAVSFTPRRSNSESDLQGTVAFSVSKGTISDAEESVVGLGRNQGRKNRGVRTVSVSDDCYVFSVSKRLVHAVAMIVMVFAIGFSILLPINHDNEQRASVIPIDEFLRKPLVIEVAGDEEITSDSAEDNIKIPITMVEEKTDSDE